MVNTDGVLSLLFSSCAIPEPAPEPLITQEAPAPPRCAELPITDVYGEGWRDGEQSGVTLLVRSAGGEHACVRLMVLDPQTGATRAEDELLFIQGYGTASLLRWRGLDAAGTLWLHRADQGPAAYDIRTGALRLSPDAFWAQNPDLRDHVEGDGLDARFDKHRRMVFSRDDGLRQFVDPLTHTARSVLEAEPPIAFVKAEQSPCDNGPAHPPLRTEPWPLGAGTLHAEQEEGATRERQRLHIQTPAGRRDVQGAFLTPEGLVDGAYSFDNQAWGCTAIGNDRGVPVLHVETLRSQADRLLTRIGGQGQLLWQTNLGAGLSLSWFMQLDGQLIVVGRGQALGLDLQSGSQVWRVGK